MSATYALSDGVVVAETGLGRLQLVARAPTSSFLIDEPAPLGGLSSGPNPYDLLCASLAACTAMTLRLYVERKNITIGRIRVGVAHQRASLEARDLFERTISVEGPLNADQRASLLQIADRCPVHRTLDRGSDVRTHLNSADDEVAAPGAGASEHVRDMEEAAHV